MKANKILLAGLLGVLCGDALDAQRRGRSGRTRAPSEKSKNHDSVKQAFRSVVAEARKSTVLVKCGGRRVALGTIVDPAGYILTKTSELLRGEITCTLFQGVELIATEVGNHYDNDVTLLKVQAKNLDAARWSEAGGTSVGSWVASPGTEDLPIAIGVMSNKLHDRKKSKFRRRSRRGSRTPAERAYLGVVPSMQDATVRLDKVQKGTAAEAAGLLSGDVILEFASSPIKDPDELITRISRRKVGEKVAIKIRRNGKELVVEAALGKDPSPSEDRRGPVSSRQAYWGPLSAVRIGYTEVLQHDSIVRPDQCGGPLVNLQGEVVGINIARVGRIETLALSAAAVQSMLDGLKNPGRPSKSEPPTEKSAKKK